MVDFGSGAGVLLIYFALMFECRVVGFEVHQGLVGEQALKSPDSMTTPDD